jgi:tetratricopeptide (TPR) repeat protein
MLLAYPNLEMTKNILRMPIYRTVEKAKDKKLSNEMILKDVLLGGGRKEAVFAADSAIRDTLQDVPNLRVGDIKPGNTKAWGHIAREAGDWSSRYHALFMTRGFRFDPDHEADIRVAAVELSEKGDLSPEVVLAQEWMVDYGQSEHNVKALRKAVDTLLAHDVLPCTPERNLYESDMLTVQEAARYCVRFGHFAEAEKIYDALGRKYPGSMLHEKSGRQKDNIRANGLQAAENEWENVVRPLVHAGKNAEAIAKLEEVVANTPNNALKTWSQAKITYLQQGK